MKAIVKPACILLAITVIAATLLGIVSEVTKEPIAIQNAKTEAEAMAQVFPVDGVEFETVKDTSAGDEISGTISKVSKATVNGELAGYVVTTNPSGFGGAVGTMVGVDKDGVITGLRVLSHSETPGLGALSTEPSFYEQFTGMSGDVKVTKDGGQVEAITSATITSRAVSDGANEALKWVSENGGAN
ncbi:MAG: RnfABCDGE type electron transport complex subunit G [Tyzzerella sp.]|uniref:Ion-translocating oxidoreductase complex subunit G n=1 Tax=Candidatus Fimicola merdigallinarum TaxID=2840819 RepID=A0A9D9DYR3_9FIRM|nr:RnfABCDGE type electron transport complex subunit G [Candidatus Fimicola merdigallinarum]